MVSLTMHAVNEVRVCRIQNVTVKKSQQRLDAILLAGKNLQGLLLKRIVVLVVIHFPEFNR